MQTLIKYSAGEKCFFLTFFFFLETSSQLQTQQPWATQRLVSLGPLFWIRASESRSRSIAIRVTIVTSRLTDRIEEFASPDEPENSDGAVKIEPFKMITCSRFILKGYVLANSKKTAADTGNKERRLETSDWRSSFPIQLLPFTIRYRD